MKYTDEQIAMVVHAANMELQRIQDDPVPSQPWFCEPEETRESATEGVRLAREGATPRVLHEGWVRWKQARGWTFGVEKDPELKTHPCLVPYDELPSGQQDKDRLFIAVVEALGA